MEIIAKKKSRIFIFTIVKNKQYHVKVLLDNFHLNGHTLGFHPQTQKLQPHLLTQSLTLGVKGLILEEGQVLQMGDAHYGFQEFYCPCFESVIVSARDHQMKPILFVEANCALGSPI